MALLAEVVHFDSPTVTGTSTVSLSSGIWGGESPKVVLIFGSAATATGSTDQYTASVGWATSATSRGSASIGSQDNVTTANTNRTNDSAFCLSLTDQSQNSAYLEKADLDSFGANQFVLDYSVASATAYKYYALALGGSTLTNAACVNFESRTTAGSQAITGVGFQPDCVLITSSSDSTENRVTIHGIFDFGIADGSTSSALGVFTEDGLGTTKTGRQLASKMINSVWNDAAREVASLTSLDADGFTLNWSLVNTNGMHYKALCLKGMEVKVLTGLQPTTNTTATRTIGFTPKAAIFASVGNTSTASIVAHNKIMIGAWDDSNNMGVLSQTDEDNVTTSNTAGYWNTNAALYHMDFAKAALGDATVAASGTDLVETWSNVDGTQREHQMIVFGAAAAGGWQPYWGWQSTRTVGVLP